MTTYLLDADVLIALTVAEHEHHARTSAWAAGIDRFALCPVVEGALVRFLVRIGESAGWPRRYSEPSMPCRVASSGRIPCRTSGRISVTFAAIDR